jgi:hypothetical protein
MAVQTCPTVVFGITSDATTAERVMIRLIGTLLFTTHLRFLKDFECFLRKPPENVCPILKQLGPHY